MAEPGAVHRRNGRRELREQARRERLGDPAVGRALDERQEVGSLDELPLFFLFFCFVFFCFFFVFLVDFVFFRNEGKGEKSERGVLVRESTRRKNRRAEGGACERKNRQTAEKQKMEILT